LLNADDFHLPSFLISSSDLPKTEKRTDQLANTTKLVINSCNNRVICPVKIMINYLNARPKVHGALFCHLNHKYLTRYQVVSVLKNAQ
jgi:hypothetical protein